jgi:hypothetical protein
LRFHQDKPTLCKRVTKTKRNVEKMEKQFYTDDNFERLLREQTERFTMQPAKRVWHSVYNDLHPARKWPSIAISLVLVVSILLLGYFNTGNKTGSSLTGDAKETNENTATAQSTAPSTSNTPVDNTATENAAASATPATIFSQQTVAVGQTINQTPVSTRRITTAPVLPNRNNRVNRNTIAINNTRTAAVSNVEQITRIANNTNSVTAETGVAAKAGNELSAKLTAAVSAEITGISKTTANNNTPQPVINLTVLAKVTTEKTSTTNKAAEKNIGADDNLQESGIVKQITHPATQQSNAVTAAKVKNGSSMKNTVTSTEDKAWMDDHAFYNKVNRGKWKNKLSWQVFATPSVSYRMLFDNTKSGENGSVVPNGPAMLLLRDKSIESSVTHKPGPGMEIGAGIVYAVTKKWRIKLGVQLNYTSYQLFANEIAHPFSTTILLNNINTGNLDIASRFTSISNIPGGRDTRMTSYSYQLALPVGVDYKIKGNNVINWYAGINLQPSFVLAGKSFLLSADRLAYVNAKENDKSLMRNFNLALGAETFVSYKKGNYTFMAGPKLRYQLLTTNSSAYTVGERAYNIGLSLGLLKNF